MVIKAARMTNRKFNPNKGHPHLKPTHINVISVMRQITTTTLRNTAETSLLNYGILNK
jgi:hypothetical protein